MLCSLYIRDYALIDELEVHFDSGLNIITGETGAGKSILIGALKLILGDRASTEVIRTGARKAIIEGIFDHADTPQIRQLLDEAGIEPQGDTVILRREIAPTYIRAFVNDTPANLQLLRAMAARLIDLHGQHEHQSLLYPETHLELLDKFGGLGALLQHYQEVYDRMAARVAERKALLQKQQDLERQQDLLAFQLEEINRLNPQPGEEEELEAEQRILSHAEQLYEATACSCS